MAFSALTAEVQAHFATEEAEMLAADYPDLDRHCEQHVRLLQGLTELRCTASIAQNFPGSVGPLVFLERWFVPHLKNDDQRWADFKAATALGPAN
jgi:hemerythrin-like metal-binding protein